MKKKRIVVALVLCLVLSMSAGVFAASFTDISGHWAESSIESAAAAGYVNGYSDGTFKPSGYITRAEFTAMVNRILGIQHTAAVSYTDVASGAWYYGDVGSAVYACFINGYSDNTFQPGKEITREEAATILSRVIPKDEAQGLSGIMKFDDFSTIGNWAKDAMGLLYNKEYIKGYPDNTIRPKGKLTRAEAISILERILEKETIVKTKVNITTPNMTKLETIFTGGVSINDSVGNYGDVSFDDCVLLCPLTIEGDIAQNIDLVDTKAVDVIQGKDGAWLYGSGSTEVNRLTIAADTYISQWMVTGAGIVNATIDADERVGLYSYGDITNLVVESPADINFHTANAGTITLNDVADIVLDDSPVGTIYVNAGQSSLRMEGESVIAHLYANANLRIYGSIFPSFMTIDNGAKVFVDEYPAAASYEIIDGEIILIPQSLPVPTNLYLTGGLDVGDDLYLKWTDSNLTGLAPDGAEVEDYTVYYNGSAGRVDVGTAESGSVGVNIKDYVEASGYYEFFVEANTANSEWADSLSVSIALSRIISPTYRGILQAAGFDPTIVIDHSTATALEIVSAPLSNITNVTVLNIPEISNQWTINVAPYLTDTANAVVFGAKAIGTGLNTSEGTYELNSPVATQSVGKLGTPDNFRVTAVDAVAGAYLLDWDVLYEEQKLGDFATISHTTTSSTATVDYINASLADSKIPFNVGNLNFGANEITASAKPVFTEGNVFWLASEQGSQTIYRLEAPQDLDVLDGTFNLTWYAGNNPADTLYSITISKAGQEKMKIEDVTGTSYDIGAAIYELGSDGIYTILITATGSSDSIIIGNPVSAPYRLDVGSRTLPVATPEGISYDPLDSSISWTVPSDYMIASYDVTVNGTNVADDVTDADMAAMSIDLVDALPAGKTSTVTVMANAVVSAEGHSLGYTNATGTKGFTVFDAPVITGFDAAEPTTLLFTVSEPAEIAAEEYALQIYENGVEYLAPTEINFNGTDAEIDLTSFINSVTIAANIGNVYTFSLMAIGNNDNAAVVTTFDSDMSAVDASISYVVPDGANALAQLSNIRLVSVNDGASIQLHWDAVVGAVNYTIQCNGGEFNPLTTVNTYIDVTNCIVDTTLADPHNFTIVANPSDADTNSPSTTTVIFERLETPVFTGITGEEGAYVINWDAVSNATGYDYLDADADVTLAGDVLSQTVTPEVTPEDVQLKALGTAYGTVVNPQFGISTFYFGSATANQEISRLVEPTAFVVGETLEATPRQYLEWDGGIAGSYLAKPTGQTGQELTSGLLYLPTSWIANGGSLDIDVTALSSDNFVVDSYAVTQTVSRALSPLDTAVDDATYQMTWTEPLDYTGNYDMKVTLEGLTHLTTAGLTGADAAGYDLVPLLQTLKNGQWGIWLRSSGDAAGLALPSNWALNTFVTWAGSGGVPVATPENLSYDPDAEVLTWDIDSISHITGFTVMVGSTVIGSVDPIAGTLAYDLSILNGQFTAGVLNAVTVTANIALGSGYAPSTGTLDVAAYSDPAGLVYTAAADPDPATLSWTASAPEGATYEIAVFNEDGSAYAPTTPGATIDPVQTDDTTYDLTAILIALNIEENYGKTFKFGVKAINETNEIGTDYVMSDSANSYTVATVDLPLVDEARIYYNDAAGEYYLEWTVGEKVASYSVKRTVGVSTSNLPDALIDGTKATIALGSLSGTGPYTFALTGHPSTTNIGKYNATTTNVTLTRLGGITFTGVQSAASGYDLQWEEVTGAVEYSVIVGSNSAVTVSDEAANFNFASGVYSMNIQVKAMAGNDATGQTGTLNGTTIPLYLDGSSYQTQNVTKLATPDDPDLTRDAGATPNYDAGYYLSWDGAGDSYSVQVNDGYIDTVDDSQWYLYYNELADGSTNTVKVTALPAVDALFTVPSDAAEFTVSKADAPEDVALASGILSWTPPTGTPSPSITGYSVMVWDVSSFNMASYLITGDYEALEAAMEPIFKVAVDPAVGSYNLSEVLSGSGKYLVGICADGDINAFVMNSSIVFDSSAEGYIVPIRILDPSGSAYQDIADVKIVVKNGSGNELFKVDYASVYGINLYLQAGAYQFAVELPSGSQMTWNEDVEVDIAQNMPALVDLQLDYLNSGYLEDDLTGFGGIAGGSESEGTYDAANKTITFTGKIRYSLANETSAGSPPVGGNYVGVKVTKPAGVTIDDTAYLDYTDYNGAHRVIYGWDNFKDGDDYFYYYPKVTATNQVLTFTVRWNQNQVETYNVVVASDADLMSAPALAIGNAKAGTDAASVAVADNTVVLPGDALQDASGNVPCSLDITGANVPAGAYDAILELTGATSGYPVNYDDIVVGTDNTFTIPMSETFDPTDEAKDYVYTITLYNENGMMVATLVFTITLSEIPAPDGGDLTWGGTGNVENSLAEEAVAADKALAFSGKVAAYGASDPTPMIDFTIVPPTGSYPLATYSIDGGAWAAFGGDFTFEDYEVTDEMLTDGITVEVRWNGNVRDEVDTYNITFDEDTTLATELVALDLIEPVTLYGPNVADADYYLIWPSNALTGSYTGTYGSTPASPIGTGNFTSGIPDATYINLRLDELEAGAGPYKYTITAHPAAAYANRYAPSTITVTIYRNPDGTLAFTGLEDQADSENPYVLSWTWTNSDPATTADVASFTASSSVPGVTIGTPTLNEGVWEAAVNFASIAALQNAVFTINGGSESITDILSVDAAAKDLADGESSYVFHLGELDETQNVTKLGENAFDSITEDETNARNKTYDLTWLQNMDGAEVLDGSYSVTVDGTELSTIAPTIALAANDYADGGYIDVDVVAHPLNENLFDVSSYVSNFSDIYKLAAPSGVTLTDRILSWGYGASPAFAPEEFSVYLWEVVPVAEGETLVGTLQLVDIDTVAYTGVGPYSFDFSDDMGDGKTYVVGVCAQGDVSSSTYTLDSSIVTQVLDDVRTTVAVEILKPDGTPLTLDSAGETAAITVDPTDPDRAAANLDYVNGGIYLFLSPGDYDIEATLSAALDDEYEVPSVQSITVTENSPANVYIQLSYEDAGEIDLFTADPNESSMEFLTRSSMGFLYDISSTGTVATILSGTTVEYLEGFAGGDGNFIAGTITAPTGITVEVPVTVTVNGVLQYAMANTGGTIAFFVKATEDVRLFQIVVQWNDERTETFIVDASLATLEEQPVHAVPSVTLETVGDFAYQLSWEPAANATSYRVSDGGSFDETTLGDSMMIDSVGTYDVYGVNGAVESATPASLTVTKFAAPTNVDITGTTLSWTDSNTGSQTFEIWEGVNKIDTVTETDGTETYTISGDPTSRTFFVRVAANTATATMASDFGSFTSTVDALIVHVMDEDGNPVAGATVNYTGTATGSFTSVAGGTLLMVEPGTVNFTVSAGSNSETAWLGTTGSVDTTTGTTTVVLTVAATSIVGNVSGLSMEKIGDFAYQLTWDAADNATSYRVSDGGSFDETTLGNRMIVDSVGTYAVYGVNGAAESATPASLVVTKFAAPTNVDITGTTLSWTDSNTGSQTFEIWEGVNKIDTVTETDGTETYTISGDPTSRTFYVRVAANTATATMASDFGSFTSTVDALIVHVMDEDGNPVAGATVNYTGTATGSFTSVAGGTLLMVEPGTVNFTVIAGNNGETAWNGATGSIDTTAGTTMVVLTVTTAEIVGDVSGLSMEKIGDFAYQLTWDAADNATSYRVSDGGSFDETTLGNSLIVDSVGTYAVYGVNGAQESTTPASLTVAKFTAPTNVDITGTTLSWTDSNVGSQTFEIWEGVNKIDTVTETDGTETYTISGDPTSRTFYVRVAANTATATMASDFGSFTSTVDALIVHVMDEDGNPVAGATVNYTGTATGSFTSVAGGTLLNVEPGTVGFTVIAGSNTYFAWLGTTGSVDTTAGDTTVVLTAGYADAGIIAAVSCVSTSGPIDFNLSDGGVTASVLTSINYNDTVTVRIEAPSCMNRSTGDFVEPLVNGAIQSSSTIIHEDAGGQYILMSFTAVPNGSHTYEIQVPWNAGRTVTYTLSFTVIPD